MATGTVDRIRITTVVDNYIDNLRQDSAVARRYSAFVAGKMPDLRAEHGLAHFVETSRGNERFTMALDFGLTAETLNHNFRELALDPASIDALGLSHGSIACISPESHTPSTIGRGFATVSTTIS